MSIGQFYQSSLGQMTQHYLMLQLHKVLVPCNPNERILVIGFGTPFAEEIKKLTSAQVILAYLEGMPPVPWPDATAHHVCVVSPDALPFGDATFDKVILLHALEFAPDASHLLFEVQRILTAQGQVVCIVPNRNGIWSWFEHTPFGEGHTFSTRQIRRLLTAVQLAPLHVWTRLFMPPIDFSANEFTRGIADALEIMGKNLNFRIGGAVIACAQKQRYAGIPVATHARAKKLRLQWAAAHGSVPRKENHV